MNSKADTYLEFEKKILFGLKLIYTRLIAFKTEKKKPLIFQKGDESIKIKPENL